MYTINKLIAIRNANNITLYDDNDKRLTDDLTYYNKVSRETTVYFGCTKEGCNSCYTKTFRRLLDTGALCQKHTQENRMKKVEDTNLKKTGYKNPLSNPEVRNKVENTNIKKYGVSYPMQNKGVSQKMSETIINKNNDDPLRQQLINEKKKETYKASLGVEHPSQSDIIKKKKEDTNLKNLGVTYPAKSRNVLSKMHNTYTERTGFANVSSNPAERIKAQITMLQKYGVRHATQNPELMHKAFTNSFRLKIYTFPSGRTTKYMGYENYAIDDLLNEEKIDEDDIYTENLQQFSYNKPNEETDRFYTPDIYVKSQNRFIEVKSTYTITQDTENIFRKQAAVKKRGIKCEIWVYDKNGIIVELHD
jgi:hypothetical protein